MAVAVETESTFNAGTPKSLFQGAHVSPHLVTMGLFESNPWDISSDSKLFLMMKPPGLTDDETTGGGPRKVNIVLNWLEELKQRIPVD